MPLNSKGRQEALLDDPAVALAEREATLDALEDGLLVVDRNARIVRANPACLRLLGHSNVVGQSAIELAGTLRLESPDGQPLRVQDAAAGQAMEGRTVRDVVWIAHRPDGSEAWLSASAAPIRTAEGIVGAVVSFRDVTGQLRLIAEREASERRLRAFFHSPMIGAIGWDLDGRITEANDRFLQIVGYTRDELATGLVSWTAMTPPEYRPLDEYALGELRTRGVDTPYEKEFLRKDGSRVPILIGAAMADEKGGVAFVLDITDRRRAERDLRESRENLARTMEELRGWAATLEERVSERTAEVERQASELRELAHELTRAEYRERQQLARVLHDHVQQLLVAAKLHIATFATRAVDTPQAQAARLASELLDQALDASRGLTIELSPPVLFGSGLGPALEWLAGSFTAKHDLRVRLAVDAQAEPASPDVRTFLFEAARELLFNVVKHAGVREARLGVTRDGDGRIRLEVADGGCGFDPGQPRSSSTNGFGLFSIQQRLRHMGGSMDIDAAPGQGTRVTLVAPVG